jgi:hypothetical protein
VREYELVEIILSVAREEGCAGRGFSDLRGSQEFTPRELFRGVSSLNITADGQTFPVVLLTDGHDLGFLGLDCEPEGLAVVIHKDDLAKLKESGVSYNLHGLDANAALAGWFFCSTQGGAGLEFTLRMLFPGFAGPPEAPG